MNEKIESLKKRVLIDNEIYKIVPRKEGDPFEDDMVLDPNGSGKYVKLVPLDLTDDEEKKYASYQVLDYAQRIDRKLNTIKNIMVFWLILAIINILLELLAFKWY